MHTEVIPATRPVDVAPAARRGAEALREGLLVGFATETVYGVAALGDRRDAIGRLRDLKDRPRRPFSVHLGRPEDVVRYVAAPPATARRLIARAWPGPLTLVLPTGGQLADPALREEPGLYGALCLDGSVGLRCPDQPLAQAMLSLVEGPVVAPSANLAGGPSPREAGAVLAALDGKIDLLIDSGPTRLGADSSIVAVDADGGHRVLRQGVLSAQDIGRMLRTRAVFICTGNTCRSPMAAGLARRMLADRLGCGIRELRAHGVEVWSAGLYAPGGSPAAPEAVEAAAELGADISRHRTRPVTKELIRLADLVFCMAESHVEQVLELDPSAAAKTRRLLRDTDVPDPLGGGPEVYRRTAELLRSALAEWMERGLL